MATITQFLGSGWVSGANIPLSWQLTSDGSMSNCGNIVINSLSEFSIDFTLNVNIKDVDIDIKNVGMVISLPGQSSSESSGALTIQISGNDCNNSGYTQVSATNPKDYSGGNAASLNSIVYGLITFSMQVWPVGATTLFYIEMPGIIPDFWAAG